ncbi:methyltransferase domain-containing protein [Patescibacteria group bacterium]|nr:MAG: methyltransferase domain-containing protein [Patescibacteria group bacterium]
MVSVILRLPPEFSYLQGKYLSSRVYPEFFSLRPTERVLVAGFGDGPQALVYAGTFKKMVGVDVNSERLARARRLLDSLAVQNVELLHANAEQVPLPDASFDAVLAIDIIEHVEHPDQFLAEMRRLLAPGGRLLITFPAMHDKFTDAVSAIARLLGLSKRRPPPAGWHPDYHQRDLPVAVWRAAVRRAGFRFVQSRATTMFQPLHLYGLPRFWLSNTVIHAIDRRIAALPLIKNLGQTVMAEFTRT